MSRVALIRGPYLRPDGVRPWEYLHNHTNYDVTAFESKPSRFDTSELDIPVKQLKWPDGMINTFGHEHILSRAISRARLPSDYLIGISELTNDFDVINTSENYNLFSFQAALACRSSQTEFVFSAGENIPYPRFQHNPLLWFMKKHVNKQADAVTTTSPSGKRAHIHEGVNHKKITVLPNSIDLDMFQSKSDVDATSLGLPKNPENQLTILFVHGLKEQKGVTDLLEAFSAVRTNRDVQLVLVGSSQLSDKHENRIKKDNTIQWLKRIPYQSMPELYSLADIFVLPSVTMVNNEEQFGMAALEAMSCEVPTVVTDTGGLPYVAEGGHTSIVVPERSPSELAKALNRLLDSPDLRIKMGKKGRKRAKQKFSQDIIGQKLKGIYDRII